MSTIRIIDSWQPFMADPRMHGALLPVKHGAHERWIEAIVAEMTPAQQLHLWGDPNEESGEGK